MGRSLRPSVRFEIFKRDGFTCVYCGRRSPEIILEVDHIVAVSAGGSDDADNLTTSCAECNLGKSNRPLDQLVPVFDAATRAQEISEREQQIVEYTKWRAAQAEREDAELEKLAEQFHAIPGANFKMADKWRWFWSPRSVRKFLRTLGYYDILDAIEITSVRAQRGFTGNVRSNAEAVWKYFCGVCWREIKNRSRSTTCPGGSECHCAQPH